MGKWKSFWFESNAAWGWINSPKEWERIKEFHPNTDLGNAKESVDYSNSTGEPYFGFRAECRGPGILKEFFEKNKMIL